MEQQQLYKYLGRCVVYAGEHIILDWTDFDSENCEDGEDCEGCENCEFKHKLEDDDITKKRLIDGLLKVGIIVKKYEDITIKWGDERDGTKCCECIVYYGEPCRKEYEEFYIDGLKQFKFGSQLEFYLEKRLD